MNATRKRHVAREHNGRVARAREVAGGCALSCSLTPAAAPTHCTPAPPPTDRGCSLSPPPVCQRSLSSFSRAPSPPCLVSCHRSQQRSRRVEGFALPAQTAATFGVLLTSPPAVLLAPHGPTFLLRRRCLCVECDPDPTLFLRPHNKQKSPNKQQKKVLQPFRFALKYHREGGQRRIKDRT